MVAPLDEQRSYSPVGGTVDASGHGVPPSPHVGLLSTIAFLAIYTVNGLAQAPQESGLPLPKPADTNQQTAQPATQPPAQLPLPLPDSGLVVTVIGKLSVEGRVRHMTRLLGQRQIASMGNNRNQSTILELIKLVEPNPAKPRGGSWKSVTLLEISFDENTKAIGIEYCVEKCTMDRRYRSPQFKRKTIKYYAREEEVEMRLNKRIAALEAGATLKPPSRR